MNEQIKFLVDLQNIDFQIKKEKEIIEKSTQELNSIKDELSLGEGVLNQEKDLFSTKEKELRQKERALEESSAHLKKSRERVYQIKNQKELEAIDEEIKKTKQEKVTFEKDILVLMEELERLSPVIKEKESATLQKKNGSVGKVDELNKILDQAQQDMEVLLKQRDEAKKKIDPSLFSEYERLCRGRTCYAVTAMTDGMCEGCHVGISSQSVNDIKKNEKIIRCEHCARIIYYPEKTR